MSSKSVLNEGVFSSSLSILFAYKFIRILTTPFNQTEAFELGIIDGGGHVLKKRKTLKTSKEKEAYTHFHQLVWKLKRLLEKVPFGNRIITSYAAALWLLKEEYPQYANLIEEKFMRFANIPTNFVLSENVIEEIPDFGILAEDVYDLEDLKVVAEAGERVRLNKKSIVFTGGAYVIEGLVDSSGEKLLVTLLKEDAPVNSAGGGNIAGIGVGDSGEPGGKRRSIRVLRRSKKREEDEKAMKEFAEKNPYHRIVSQSTRTGNILFFN